MTLRFAVFGHPIAHSLSPRLQAWFAQQAGIELEYVAIDAAPEGFADAVHAFFARGGRGANVTVPHKAVAFGLAASRTPVAGRLGVANVLTHLPDGGIEADSNDGAGLVADLVTRRGVALRDRDVLLLGAGGAARAVAVALLDAGVRRITIANRTLARAEALAATLAEPARVRVIGWSGLPGARPPELLVNATSAGVQHVELALPPTLVGPRTVAYDLSYGTPAAPFVAWARSAGAGAAHAGLGMLVETAAASFFRWHGLRPDTDAALRMLGDS